MAVESVEEAGEGAENVGRDADRAAAAISSLAEQIEDLGDLLHGP